MNKSTWRDLYRIARRVRATGYLPHDVRVKHLGSGIEKVCYALRDYPGWVLKLGGGTAHVPEGRTYHLLPSSLRPKTVFLPLRVPSDKTAVQIQESATLVAGHKPAERDYFRPVLYEAIEALLQRGFSDTHDSNMGFAQDGRVVCLDWGSYCEDYSLSRERYRRRSEDPATRRQRLEARLERVRRRRHNRRLALVRDGQDAEIGIGERRFKATARFGLWHTLARRGRAPRRPPQSAFPPALRVFDEVHKFKVDKDAWFLMVPDHLQ